MMSGPACIVDLMLKSPKFTHRASALAPVTVMAGAPGPMIPAGTVRKIVSPS